MTSTLWKRIKVIGDIRMLICGGLINYQYVMGKDQDTDLNNQADDDDADDADDDVADVDDGDDQYVM